MVRLACRRCGRVDGRGSWMRQLRGTFDAALATWRHRTLPV